MPTPARATALNLPGLARTLAVTLVAASDNQAVVLADDFRKLIFAYAGFDDDFNVGHCFEQVDTFLCEFVCNKNFNHLVTPKKF